MNCLFRGLLDVFNVIRGIFCFILTTEADVGDARVSITYHSDYDCDCTSCDQLRDWESRFENWEMSHRQEDTRQDWESIQKDFAAIGLGSKDTV